MLKTVLDRKVNKESLNARFGTIEDRLDSIERRQNSALLYVLLFVGGFSAIVMGMTISEVTAEVAGKVAMGVGLVVVVVASLSLLRRV
jgi:hypothetical protein